ncbi:MAG: hypothetical protein IPM80_09260 [Proteobacteria bacterium]|nr:hypothetical protein [Pseudomonadota bacterium]
MGISLTGDEQLLWAKSSRSDDERWHPLVLHLLDVAACADAILAREPERRRAALHPR